MKDNKINCFECSYYFITWDKRAPRGCRAMNFKTKQMPSAVVLRSSGEPCLRFRPKKQGPV